MHIQSTCKALITPLQALRLASSHLSSPATRLTQVSHSALFVIPHSLIHSLTLSFPPCRYIEHSVRTLSRKCLPSTTQSQEQNMTLFSLVVAVEAQPVRYVSPVSTEVQELTTSSSRVASRLALWRKDRPHRRIRKARRYMRKRW
jgi:hypothetical protein